MEQNEEIIIKNKFIKKIFKLAEKTGKSPSIYLNEALENYFEEFGDLVEGLRRLKDKTNKIVNRQEILSGRNDIYD
jgi:predicted DNA-binding protein